MTVEVAQPPTAWTGSTAVTPADRHAAVDRLPGLPHLDPFERLAMAFLAGYPAHSARAYRGDLRSWWSWCHAAGVHPFDARRHHVDAWIRILTTHPLPRTGRAMSATSISRRLSAVSQLYTYGMQTEVLTYSPVAHVRRPKVTTETTAVGLSATELVALLDAADAHSPRFGALLALLAYNGLRINEALATDVADYTHQRGHRVLRITRKGGKVSLQPLAPPTVRALDTYLTDLHPPTGPVFLNRTHTARLPYETAFAQIRRLAHTAAIPAADKITPHSLRHTFVTEALAAGVPLQDVQDAAGHADPGITRRYDRSRINLDRHPTYILAAHLHRTIADPDPTG